MMSIVLTIIAMAAGVVMFCGLFSFLLVGLFTWLEKHDMDPIAAAADWVCEFWEKRL